MNWLEVDGAEWRLKWAGWRWMELGGAGWRWMEGWRWVQGLVIPNIKSIVYELSNVLPNDCSLNNLENIWSKLGRDRVHGLVFPLEKTFCHSGKTLCWKTYEKLLSNFAWFLYFVPNILSRIVCTNTFLFIYNSGQCSSNFDILIIFIS